MTTFGIGDMAFYVPAPAVDLRALIERRRAEGAAEARLLDALEYTGQHAMRVADWYEDTVTMLAEATRTLLSRPGAPPPERIRHYACGTETAHDAAKPVSSYVQGLVEVGGRKIGPHAATYEIKHACASGTYSLLGALQALAVERQAGRQGVAVAAMGDIASYPRGSTAELTQGAGAVALLVEAEPRLLAIDLGFTGVYGESVDDFFRALSHRHASVRGRYSVECYLRALHGAYLDYKGQALEAGLVRRPPGGHFLDSFDYAVLHAPFHSLPVRAMHHLLRRLRGHSHAQAEAELQRLHVPAGLELVRRTGNLYAGSLYLCLAELLVTEFDRIGDALEGKRLLLASYGSGNTMVVFSATVQPGAGPYLRRLGVREAVREHERAIDLDEYDGLAGLDRSSATGHRQRFERLAATIPKGRYCLERIRGDGYREYREQP